jgi:hypothetical protein
MQDAARYPQLFVWNGTIESNQLEVWLQEHQLNLPQDLIELWKQTNGGDLFESETILSPFGDDSLGDDIEGVNEFHYSQGMSKNYLLFHLGTGLSAVRLTDNYYVKLDESYQEIAQFQSLDDWYRDELRSEYGKRYNQHLGDIKMSSAGVEDSNSEITYLELKEKFRTGDLLEETDSKIFGVMPERVAEVEKTLNPDEKPSGWLLPTLTLCKRDLDSFTFESNQEQEIDRWFLNLMTPDRIQKTLSNWEKELSIKSSKSSKSSKSINSINSINKERYLILKEAVEVHLNRQFYASVSTLMPQLEGLIRDILDESVDFTSLLTESRNRVEEVITKLTDRWKNNNDLLQYDIVMLNSLPILVGNLYDQYKPKKHPEEIIEGKLYRHGVCHGLQPDFGSPKNSLQLILLLDRIIYFIRLEEIDEIEES